MAYKEKVGRAIGRPSPVSYVLKASPIANIINKTNEKEIIIGNINTEKVGIKEERISNRIKCKKEEQQNLQKNH